MAEDFLSPEAVFGGGGEEQMEGVGGWGVHVGGVVETEEGVVDGAADGFVYFVEGIEVLDGGGQVGETGIGGGIDYVAQQLAGGSGDGWADCCGCAYIFFDLSGLMIGDDLGSIGCEDVVDDLAVLMAEGFVVGGADDAGGEVGHDLLAVEVMVGLKEEGADGG